MDLMITNGGEIRCVYAEDLDLATLGSPTIRRASHVEPALQGGWTADLAPVDGPVLGPFTSRSDALRAEMEWLNRHWLIPQA